MTGIEPALSFKNLIHSQARLANIRLIHHKRLTYCQFIGILVVSMTLLMFQ
jgi:hypothetical protein